MKKVEKSLSAGTDVQKLTNAHDSSVSQPIAKPGVSRRFLFQYRGGGLDLMAIVSCSSLNGAMIEFATQYKADKVYKIAELGLNGG